MSTDLERTPVITAFVERDDKILLLRRSPEVSTYPGKWAAVSGYIEQAPLEQAYAELTEEVGLTPERIRMRGIGRPVLVDDADKGCGWIVYPFLFELKPNYEPRLNWEASEHAWVTPAEIAGLDTVPGLEDVRASVMPGFGNPGVWGLTRRLSADRLNGATVIATEALDALEHFQAGDKAGETARVARALAALRPSMGIIPHVMARAAAGESPAKLKEDIALAGRAAAEITAQALSGLDVVLTHSASSVCESAIRLWAEAGGREVICTESRPQGEGVALAERLARDGIAVRLITDAQIGVAARQADALLLGCDAITGDGFMVNKVGSELAAIAAEQANRRVCVVAQTHKIPPPGWPISLERQDPADVLAARNIKAQNIVFDAISLRRLQVLITERGPLTDTLLKQVQGELAGSPLAV